ncbi:unnamed protein product [Sphagnum jensenii]|uniref:CBS domain-containing protein n=2 Tax=Sphagnum jensenii TaxID=128206 RepID=A0ABP1AXV8_9BRYO
MAMVLKLGVVVGSASQWGEAQKFAIGSKSRGKQPQQPKSVFCGLRRQQQQQRLAVVRASGDNVEVQVKEVEEVETMEELADILPSGEWPENFSLLNFEDLSKHYEPILFKLEAQPSKYLADVMSSIIATASPYQLLEDVHHHFTDISGLPVIDHEYKCVGVLSKKDVKNSAAGLKALVCNVMSTPAITLSAEKTVSDAAVLMLKNKIHRIPIVNESNQLVGIVTRTDIFTAMETSE